MTPHTLKEFAENLRVSGNWREAEFATEILDLLDLETEVAEPYSNLRDDLEHYAKNFSNPDDASKALEWIGDRSNLLAEIEEQLKEADKTGDADDVVKALLETLTKIRTITGLPDTATDEDLETAVEALAERPAPTEYDL